MIKVTSLNEFVNVEAKTTGVEKFVINAIKSSLESKAEHAKNALLSMKICELFAILVEAAKTMKIKTVFGNANVEKGIKKVAIVDVDAKIDAKYAKKKLSAGVMSVILALNAKFVLSIFRKEMEKSVLNAN